MKNQTLLHLVQPEIKRLLIDGLNQDQFKIYYHPIVDAKMDAVLLFDLSICWHHERYGVLEAMQFLPLIKQLPEYEQLAHRFFACVSRRIQFFKSIGKPTRLIIPVLSAQLEREDGIDLLRSFLERHAIDSQDILLKVIGYDIHLPERLLTLHKLGFQIIMSYELRVQYEEILTDYILISRHIIEKKRLLGEPLLKEILQAMFEKMRCQWIVQQIEEESQQLFLEQYGIRYFQGPYYSDPLPFDEMFKKLL